MKQLPRLLVLASTYPRWQDDPEPGFVHELCKRLTERFEVTVLCPHSKAARSEEILDNVNVMRYRYAPVSLERLVNNGGIVGNLRRHPWMFLLLPSFFIAQWWCVRQLIRRLQPELIHAHWLIPQGLIACWQGRMGPRIPFVVTSHGADLFALNTFVMRWLKRRVAKDAAVMTVVGEAMSAELQKQRIKPRELYVEPMGVDLEARFIQDMQAPRSKLDILFVGRLVEKKGVRLLLEAMPEILLNEPHARLIIAGFGPDHAFLEETARRMKIDGSVIFAGAVRQEDLPALYRSAAVLAAPFVEAASGDQEGLGLVVVEALGCGCPVVAGKVAATARAFNGFDSVSLVDARDISALSGAIVARLRSKECVSSADSAKLKSRFDWGKRATVYAGILDHARSMQQVHR